MLELSRQRGFEVVEGLHSLFRTNDAFAVFRLERLIALLDSLQRLLGTLHVFLQSKTGVTLDGNLVLGIQILAETNLILGIDAFLPCSIHQHHVTEADGYIATLVLDVEGLVDVVVEHLQFFLLRLQSFIFYPFLEDMLLVRVCE